MLPGGPGFPQRFDSRWVARNDLKARGRQLDNPDLALGTDGTDRFSVQADLHTSRVANQETHLPGSLHHLRLMRFKRIGKHILPVR